VKCSVLQCVAVFAKVQILYYNGPPLEIHNVHGCNKLQHTATHCNTLQPTANHYNPLPPSATQCNPLQPTATHFTGTGHPWERTSYMGVPTACWAFPSSSPHPVLQCVAVCCSMLQRVAVCCSVLQRDTACCSALQRVAVRCSVSQCVAVC